MRLFSSLTAAMLLASVQSIAQDRVQVTPMSPSDGDTFRTREGRIVRMYGIDAPELAQSCQDGWDAGHEATQYLRQLIEGKTLSCENKGRDQWGRWIAQCFDGQTDIGREMVLRGYAWAFVKYSVLYVAEQQWAQMDKVGVHKHGCQPAWEYRAEHRRR